MSYNKPPFAWGYKLLSYALLTALLFLCSAARSQISNATATPRLTYSYAGNPGVTLIGNFINLNNVCISLPVSWQKSIDRGATWTIITGAATHTYTPANVTTTTYYRFVATCVQDRTTSTTIYSMPAIVWIYSSLVAGSVTPSQTIAYNTAPDTLRITGVTGGNNQYTYQWQYSVDNSTWTTLSGATAAYYNPGNLTNTTYYRVQVTSFGRTATSTVATITVQPQEGLISSTMAKAFPKTPLPFY